MTYYLIISFFLLFILFIYCSFYRKIDAGEFFKIIQSGNKNRIKKYKKRVIDINKKMPLKTSLLPKNHQIKTKMINETVEYKTSFINIESATVLMVALIYNVNIEIIEEIIKSGADINAVDENKNTAFLYAVLYYKNPDILDLLIKYGADKNDKNILGANAVMVALYNPEIKILSKIISLGVDINYQNKGGWSPLMSIALDFRSVEMAKILIENGADVNLKNRAGKTVIDIAQEFNNKEIIGLISSIS